MATAARQAGGRFVGKIDNMIRGGGGGGSAAPPGAGPPGSVGGGGGGGSIIGSVRGIIQTPLSWGNSLFSSMPGPLSRLGRTWTIAGISISTGMVLLIGYFAYTRYM